MEQTLQNLLYSRSPRTAWIVLGTCTALWLVSLTGILIPPSSAPAYVALLWFYAMLMLYLASALAVIGAVAVLLAHRRAVPASAGAQPAAPEAEDSTWDELAGPGRILDDPDNLREHPGNPPTP